MSTQLLDLDIVTGPVVVVSYAVAGALLVYLLVRPGGWRWIRTLAITLLASLLGGTAIVLLLERGLNLFGGPIGAPARVWGVVAIMAIAVALVNLWRSRWWRKALAGLGVVAFALAATVGINAAFGINPTLGAFLHISTEKPITLATPKPQQKPPAGPLYETWKPPANMPASEVGSQVIPGVISGFNARPAGIYLPPAARVKNAPALPLMILMMGQPGDPNPTFVQQVLDKFAAKHQGLAPIVVVADQLGNPNDDTLCLDTAKYGKVETYITQDVMNWAHKNLNVIQDPAYTTVAGYSNGGVCSIYFAAKYPTLFHNVIDISGEEYQGTGNPKLALREVFGGNQVAYNEVKPLTILGRNTYPETTAIFTAGANDPLYTEESRKVEAGAKAAGMKSTLVSVPGAGHGADALLGGLEAGFNVLYPVLGLQAK
ncbi:enterochelin esterase-like enzyme [Mycetocola sp. BIGb0189]|uniref:alpha/beta hydrolase n=1 Tax=Mycetocola sp. BIGb0189 TaxID=2940604 RepID=UPI00216A4DCF|nr:alpha/beta hydrolase-fold protein [Mycetocola sp. BIGb0189]MCS4276787.1 enterochelin esterase-like enzyme [Mycetocola sp. BIGb0189]